jgi:hypothetical protein
MKKVENIWAELSANKTKSVELSAVEDIKQAVQKVRSIFGDLEGLDVDLAIKEVRSVTSDLEQIENELSRSTGLLYDVLQDAALAADSLGLEASDIPGYDQAESVSEQVEETLSQIGRKIRVAEEALQSLNDLQRGGFF